MTKGVLIFAINNGSIDYQSIARWSAERIKQHLDLPVTLVTDTSDSAGSRYFDDFDQVVDWHNHSRTTAYDVSPYEHTLLLDADYVVSSNQLLTLFNQDQDFLCHRFAVDATGLNDYSGLNWFGRNHMPMSWATVVCYRKGVFARNVFDMMSMVKQNWSHYCALYGIGRSTYRNDYSISIALNTLTGHQAHWPSIPWSLVSVDPKHRLTQTGTDSFRVNFETPDKKLKWIELVGQDFHAMCKKDLGDIVANQS